MLDFFYDNFSNCIVLAVLIVALVPTIESRTAIPFAMSKQIWGTAVLSPISACLISFVGSMIPAILMILLGRFLKRKTEGFVYEKSFAKIQKHIDRFNSKNNTFSKCLFLAGFVAIPLPLTGVYTGGLLAGFSNLSLWQSVLSVFSGEVVSCIAITILCSLFDNSAFYLLIFSFVIGVIVTLLNLFAKMGKKKDKSDK